MPVQYPEVFKINIIRRYESGEKIKDLSQELHISQSTLYRWRKEYRTIQAPGHSYTPAEFDALSRRLQKAEHELEVIRPSNYITEVPRQKRLSTLEELYHHPDNSYSVHELCDALSIPRGTFYNHIFRSADQSKYKDEQMKLMLKVQQIFDDSKQRYGAEKIRVILAEDGIRTSAKRISSIMQELGLKSIRTNAKKDYKKRQRNAKQNLLKQQFSTERPNQVWVGDFTYFRISGHWLYFCMILDLYSRKIVGYRVSKNPSTNLVTATFRKMFKDRGRPEGLTFHSDRGKQYTSKTFTALLRQYGVRQTFSASGRPHDNAVAETFFATFKKEEAYRREYTSEQSFYKSVEKYVQFYNEARPHRTLKYKTPQEYENAYEASFR